MDWMIIYGDKHGTEGFALIEVDKLIHRFIFKPIRTESSEKINEEDLKRYNLIILGTEKSNRLIAELLRKKNINIKKEESYVVIVEKNPYNTENQIVWLIGIDPNGVLYAVRDFEHYIVDQMLLKVNSAGELIMSPFRQRFEEVSIVRSPLIDYRGLWTWGHVIYDWKRYLENMSRWKMNSVIIWNDFAPVNAEEIVSYAHQIGVKVIWGYSWGWGENLDPTSIEDLKEWTDKVIKTYEIEYKDTNCDGIYFQIFTETYEKEIKGTSIAELATRWVNYISQKLLERYPEVKIFFGLHAISIGDNYYVFKDIPEEISIIWEDIGTPKPQFPFSYDPFLYEGPSSTEEYLGKILKVRGEKEKAGVVVKSMINLNWEKFEHQPGGFILGEYPSEVIDNYVKYKYNRWRLVEIEWKENFEYLSSIIKLISELNLKESSVFGLVEDGLWEKKMWLPVALLSESLWTQCSLTRDLVKVVSATNDVFKIT